MSRLEDREARKTNSLVGKMAGVSENQKIDESKTDLKPIGFYLRPDQIKQLKICAAESDTKTNNSAIVREALDEYFEKRGK